MATEGRFPGQERLQPQQRTVQEQEAAYERGLGMGLLHKLHHPAQTDGEPESVADPQEEQRLGPATVGAGHAGGKIS